MNYIEYDESLLLNSTYPEGFMDLLKGIPLEEQIIFFHIGNELYLKEEFSKLRKSEYHTSKSIQTEDKVQAIIVHNNLIAGIMVRNCYGKIVPCLPEKRIYY